MKPVLVPFDPVQERTDLSCSPPLVPFRKSRAQVQTKHTSLSSCRNNLEKRMPRISRVVPLVIVNCLTTEKPNRMVSSSRPKWKFGCLRDTFNDVGMRGFLEDDQIGCSSNYRFRECFFPSQAAKPDVVTKQPERHAFS